MSNKIKGVFGIIFSEDKQSMLMVKRRDFPLWVYPGGGREKNESLEEACIRELREETGLECEITRKICEYDHKKFAKVSAALFECRVLSGELQITSETRDIAFFPVKEPPKTFFPVFKEFLEHAHLPSPNKPQQLKCVNASTAVKFFFYNPLTTLRFLLTRMGLHFNSN